VARRSRRSGRTSAVKGTAALLLAGTLLLNPFGWGDALIEKGTDRIAERIERRTQPVIDSVERLQEQQLQAPAVP